MDDLAGPGESRGSDRGRTAGTTIEKLRDDDVSDTEVTAIIPIDGVADQHETLTPADWDRYYRPSRSEITQDILIPEHEFEQYADEPLDAERVLADGGRLDEIEPATQFHRIPAGAPARRTGKHRLPAPPKAIRGGRAALVAMAAGAAVAAVAQVSAGEEAPAPVNAANVGEAAPAVDLGPGVAAAQPANDLDVFANQLVVGKQMADAEDAREALARRPMFASPIPMGKYDFTSAFAMRWGSFHGGVDMAAPLGTPIHAASDGVVIEAGPASGYGHWVQVQAADGTVTMYGHMSSSGVLVQKGQQVTAGDVIALVGNEGFSTGPHLHFEVWKNGSTKVDPMPWLAANGVRMSGYTG